MEDFFSLKILDLFRPLFEAFGVEYEKMRLIVNMKLTLDKRKNNSSENKNSLMQSVILYLIIGFVASRIIVMQLDIMTKMTVLFALIFVMLLTCFITDFSSVILDTYDRHIIGITDVKDITLNMAKIVHIVIYISIMSLSISAFSILMILMVYNIGFCLLFILCMILMDFLLIMMTSVIYYLLIKIFKGEKLKDVLNLFQIFMILVFSIIYYFITSSLSDIQINYTFSIKAYDLFIPFMWFASLFCVIFYGKIQTLYIIMSILGIIVPILSIFIYIKLTPAFERNLEKLEQVSYNEKDSKTKKSFVSKLGDKICKNNEEKSFFEFIYINLSRDREFKTRVYPTLASGIIMPLVLLIVTYDRSMSIMEYLKSLSTTNNFLNIYLAVILLQNCILLLKYSKEYEASFIYDVLPISKKKNIYSAEFKVIIIKLFVPVFIIIGIPYLILFKSKFIVHLLIAFVSTIFISMGTFRVNDKSLPFSEDYAVTANTSNFLNIIKSIGFVGVAVLLHYLIILKTPYIFSVAYLILLILIMKIIWNKVFDI
ncbi:hypothetical protein [Intestinibacter bartlettii]|uniref:ABC-2 type transporter n=2 Tax=root TaxID=1 RepID=A0ABS8CWZ2_9FIRM|nr:hypothetical protein [Intestinibacter bartlettii]MCB5396949.1 hypothetical protein [Intestinibacter bartlettii]MCB5403498.1 hypothetical protein [Intestinibacter bartlettii]MCB5445755.1 hypothetical protein [Intestinibacter bartlettii]MCB5719418.1 hypothetical protein [Intestinibacter bartlettii]MCB5748363.1 hypothetical protein [Intestinibacter bartlettii]